MILEIDIFFNNSEGTGKIFFKILPIIVKGFYSFIV